MVMATVPLIVCEKSGRWALALRAALRGDLPLVETRAPSQCSEALLAAPTALAAVAVTPQSLASMVELIGRISRDFPAARVLALLEPGAESAEPLLREAGAADVFLSPQQAAAIAGLAQRHAALSPAARLPLRAASAARLPWQRWATPDFAASHTPSQE